MYLKLYVWNSACVCICMYEIDMNSEMLKGVK